MVNIVIINMYSLELSIKEGQNHGFDPSLNMLSIRSMLAHHVSEPILKIGCKFWDLLFSNS